MTRSTGWVERAADLTDLAPQAGQRLGDDDAEAVDVGRRRDRIMIELLRRRVRRAQRRRPRRIIRWLPVGADRDPEIGQVGVAVVVDQDVGRLDVAVDDAGPVGRLQRAAELVDHRGRLLGGQGSIREHVGEVAALHQPHHEVGRVRLAPVVVERHDVRVFEPGDELCLGLEATDEVRVVGEFRSDHLDRDLATDGGLIRPIGHPERALADLLAQFVAADSESGSRTVGSDRHEFERLVAGDDLLLQAPEPARRVDAELLAEP